MGPNYAEEIDCNSFFDQIDDLIEFPPDNDCHDSHLAVVSECKNLLDMWNDVLPENDPIFSSSHLHSASDLSVELSVPHEDILQLEWLSTFMEDSFSGEGMTIGKDNLYMNKDSSVHSQFKSTSLVSELESSSSSSSSCSGGVGKAMPMSPTHRSLQRARSKRPRPASFNPRPPIQIISSASSTEAPSTKLSGEEPKKKKKKKIKITFPATDSTALAVAINDPPPVRKCLHCEITKTPQWRAGPLGPKTLCNACGVRHKSGRLFPEYRPAASPTFVPSMHSNSHKKVIEMRSKAATETPQVGPKPNLVP